MKLLPILALACLAAAALPAAAQPVPDAGLRAEMQGQWTDAVGIYQRALAANPAQANLWERIADIRATRLNDPAGAAEALREATQYAPMDARLHYKLSQAYAVIQKGPSALAAIAQAVELDPGNPAYLRARGEIALWTGYYAVATDSFERILAATPQDADALLGLARASARNGKKDAAVSRYRTYLAQRPQDKDVMLEYMELEAERGDSQAVQEYGTLYRQRFGTSKDYWLRMADLYALGTHPAAASAALKEASRLDPQDHALLYRLAQSYSTDKEAGDAADAIEHAVALDPTNLEYLRSRADIAAWRSDYATALDSYRRILGIAPDDPGARLGIARVYYWRSQLADSARAYRDYLARQPGVAAASMEYIVVVTELGDYARAMELLEAYKTRFGDNLAYRKQKARVLAWAERPTPALGLIATLEPELRDDYELGYTRTIALHYAHRPREALASLADVARLRLDSKETADLTRFIYTPQRSNATLNLGYESASDNITLRHAGLAGEYVINPETRLFGGADRQSIDTKAGSPYARPDGGTTVGYNRAWLGVQHRISPRLSLDAQIGGGTATGDSRFLYELGADLQPRDELALRLSRRQDLFAVSPRAAALGIERRANTLDATWTPDLRYTVASRLAYDTFSDGNDRWEAELAPRRAILRTQRLNLDLGVSGRWFGFDQDPGNGYYAPSLYQRYALTAFTYWKISDDDGVSVAFSYGPYKDNTQSGFRSGGDIVAEGFFGLYRDWFLDVKTGFSSYGGGPTAGYRSRTFELGLTRRF
ncbi:tetratricopeptide repeat protein [Thiobacillus sp.]|jgi:Tfp pilus assembly protein PilF|uniref:tetratricopeptide repeat protein n=1 Tax=Thiobacillus sp. TaxID=924 RepID=UPI0025D04A91|nr:tetratricopeptide repeat protein [Thiobacillus sp.]